MAADAQKLSLPAFLQLLTSNKLPMKRAMAVAGKIYKEFCTPERLGQLTDVKLTSLGVAEKEDRKLVLSAIAKAGYREGVIATVKEKERKKRKASGGQDVEEGASKPGPSSQIKHAAPAPKRRRKQNDGRNELLPDKPADEGATFGSLDFEELRDEQILKDKFVVVNRAPIMMAWSFVVAERLGFEREEALSIASVYTEMNAIAKGVSLGIYDEGKGKNLEAQPHGDQPYVDIMGRRIPLYQTAAGSWRALAASKPAPAGSAYSYITRSLRQTTPAVIGAMRLLAESYGTTEELNRVGWALYADFRPEVNEWGKKGEVRCEKILSLRRHQAVKADDNEATKSNQDGDFVTKAEGGEQDTGAAPRNAEALENPSERKISAANKDPDTIDEWFDDFTADDLEALP
ncbi:hypothetical protein DENSPDRAFT_925863 [Dentipellis sp. KUC8613]|nr:hypothetical protein DENSPDRAFT_925863 [Dentipellis sp. KUC8613]